MGRVYTNFKEAISENHRNLLEMGVLIRPKSMQDKIIEGNDDYATRELEAVEFTVLDTSDRDEMILKFKGQPYLDWCKADVKERLSGEAMNPGEAYKLREVWGEFLHDGKFGYTYSERIAPQLQETIDLLKWDPQTRQAMITIYEGRLDSANRGGKVRVPCSLYYQFLYRDGKLDVIYTMRSNDLLEHMPADLWMAAEIQQHIADAIGVAPGRLFYFCGSLHAYAKDIPKVI